MHFSSTHSTPPIHGGNLAWAATLAGCSPNQLLDFSASINPLGPPPSAIAAIQAHLPHLRDYPDPSYSALRLALGRFHNLSPDWVLPGNGAAELLTWASRDLAELEAVFVLAPAFGDYLRALQAFGVTPRLLPLPLPPDSPVDALWPLLSGPSGFLVNNPHNPTGYLFSQAELKPLLQEAALVVLDEAFMDFLPPEQEQSLIDQVEQHPNLVIVRSLTKFYSLPGLRLGYAVAHPDRLRRWQQWRDPWSVNSLAAAAGVAVLEDEAFQRQTLSWLPVARQHLMQGLQQIPGLLPLPGSANFLLVQSDQSVTALQRRLLEQHRILIRDCMSFPELGDRYFRLAVRTESENQRLLTALAEGVERDGMAL